MLPLSLLPLFSMLLFALPSYGAVNFNLSSPAECAPLNISFTPSTTSGSFPYVVWISSLYSAAESFQINSDYQRDANGGITFQYNVPPQSNTFNTFAVTVSDSRGNGNTSRPLASYARSGGSTSCDPYTVGTSFFWAGDSLTGATNNMVQCGQVKFYTLDNRGTRPYTITFVPIGGVPQTVNVPSSATPNQTFFNYTTVLPYSVGTQFFVVLGDDLGGVRGGSSPLYTVGESNDNSCLSSNFQLPNKQSGAAVPINGITASFANLAGAVLADQTGGGNSTAGAGSGGSDSGGGTGTGTGTGNSAGSGGSGGGGTNTGAVVGGVIGGVIALAAVAAILIGYWLYKRRQRRLREAARKEEDHFVDLDGDEDMEEAPTGGGMIRAKRRQSGGVRQSYNVSPFPYTANDSHSAMTPATPTSPGLAFAGGQSMGRRSTDALSGGPTSNQDWQSTTSPRFQGPAATVHSRTNSQASGLGLRAPLRATNADTTEGAPALPRKLPLPGDEETAEQSSTSRLVQHSDAGPVAASAQPPVAEEQVEELPPSYGGWLGRLPSLRRQNPKKEQPLSSGADQQQSNSNEAEGSGSAS